MTREPDLEQIRQYFEAKFSAHGESPRGVDWSSVPAQTIRFDQILKVCDFSNRFTINDYGCGYGALAEYLLGLGLDFRYNGFDISAKMIAQAQERFKDHPEFTFTDQEAGLAAADYTVSSGIFNIFFPRDAEVWKAHILDTLAKMDALSRKGFSFNMLTSYSDPGYMRPDLYYADPCYFFDYCKTHFSKNVALLHDYVLYDFTILVRKGT
jgi:SAM-dependent methyltransferase